MEFEKPRNAIIFGIVLISGILFFIFDCRNPKPPISSISITDFNRSNEREYNAKVRDILGLDNIPTLSDEYLLDEAAEATRLSITSRRLSSEGRVTIQDDTDLSHLFIGGDAWISAKASAFYFKINEEELIEYRVIEGKIYSFLNYHLENITFIETIDDNFYIDGKEYIINNEKLLVPK